MEYALRFEFQASNNEAEYEAVIAGLNLAHSMEVDQLEICPRTLPEPSVNVDDEEVSLEMSEKSWMDPIWDYLVDGTLQSYPNEASKLKARLARFTIHRETLYKRGFSTSILKCVGKKDANYVLREIH